MSGGDGKGHNSGAQATGGVNGASGGTGGTGSGGGPNIHASGFSDPKNPGGMGISITSGDNTSGSGRPSGGNGGSGNGGGNAGNNNTSVSYPKVVINGWHSDPASGTFSTTKTSGVYYGFHHLEVESKNGIDTYNLYFKANKKKPAFIAVVKNGNLGSMEVKYDNGKKVSQPGSVKKIVQDFVKYKGDEEKAIRDGVSLAAGINKEISSKIGDKFAKIAEELEAGIKGKKIRNSQDAEKTYERLKKSLDSKIKAKDRDAIVAWLKKVDAQQYTKNARVLGKFFTGLDWTMKGLDVKDAAVKGFATGDWKPLRNQLEAIALAAGAGYALAAIAAFFAPVAVSSVAGIFAFAYLFGWLTSFIDADLAGKLENLILSL